MAVASYIARVDERGAVKIPKEAQDVLQLHPGEEVQVSIQRIPAISTAPNQKMLSILRDIQARHKNRPYTDSADTDRLLLEAKSGAMYHDERTE